MALTVAASGRQLPLKKVATTLIAINKRRAEVTTGIEGLLPNKGSQICYYTRLRV